MTTRWTILGAMLFFVGSSQAALTVTHAVAAQRPGTKLVDITYDVSSGITNAVIVSVAIFEGTNNIGASSLSGDIGVVSTGTGKSILWNAGADWNGQVDLGLKCWLVAADGVETTPPPLANMVVIPADVSSGTDPDSGAFSITLTNNLFVGAFEVSKSQWDAVAGWADTNGYGFDNSAELSVASAHPAVAVNWFDCVKWCNARSEMEGLTPCYTVGGAVFKTGNATPDWHAEADGYRLPTSSEWEFCARGRQSSARFPWGNTVTHNQANYTSASTVGYDVSATRGPHPLYKLLWPSTAPVGSFPPNDFGLFDVAGNVMEWCWDSAALGTDRVLRGGSCDTVASVLRCGHSLAAQPINSAVDRGFRTVRTVGSSISGTAVASVDTRNYSLSVASDHGSPVPGVGVHAHAWQTVVTCSVAAVVSEAGTNYTSTGWVGTGSVPESDRANTTAVITLNELSSTIRWGWFADNDFDRIDNAWEAAYFGGITNAVASDDPDGDLYSNWQEYILGTIPTNSASALLFQITDSQAAGPTQLECLTVEGRLYTVEYATSMASPSWSVLTTFVGSGTNQIVSDPTPAVSRFYRVRAERP